MFAPKPELGGLLKDNRTAIVNTPTSIRKLDSANDNRLVDLSALAEKLCAAMSSAKDATTGKKDNVHDCQTRLDQAALEVIALASFHETEPVEALSFMGAMDRIAEIAKEAPQVLSSLGILPNQVEHALSSSSKSNRTVVVEGSLHDAKSAGPSLGFPAWNEAMHLKELERSRQEALEDSLKFSNFEGTGRSEGKLEEETRDEDNGIAKKANERETYDDDDDDDDDDDAVSTATNLGGTVKSLEEALNRCMQDTHTAEDDDEWVVVSDDVDHADDVMSVESFE